MLEIFFLRGLLMLDYCGGKMKVETKAKAGRKGGIAKVAKGFARNPFALAKAIRASAATRRRKAKERRKLVAGLAASGAIGRMK